MVSLKDVFMEYYITKNREEKEFNMSIKNLYEDSLDLDEEDEYYESEDYEDEIEDDDEEDIRHYDMYDYADYYYDGQEISASDLDIFDD